MSGDTGSISVLLVDGELDVDEMATSLETRIGTLDVIVEKDPTVVLERLENEDADCIVSGYEMSEMDGIELLEAVREGHPNLPFILYTGSGGKEVASKAISAGVTEYVPEQHETSQFDLLSRRILTTVNEYQPEDEIVSLHRINRTLRETIQAVLRAETQTAVKQAVCETLADSDPYVFAWFGTVTEDDRVVPEASAGVEDGYLDSIDITVDRTATGQGPTGTAVRTGKPQAVQNVQKDPDYEVWREEARKRGYRSSAAIPIRYEDKQYGVLNVYADRPSAFDGRELEVFAEVGATIGHAIYRIALSQRLEDQYRTLFEEAPVMAVTTRNEEGNPVIEDCNRRFLQTIGRNRSEVIGQPLKRFYTKQAEHRLLEEDGYVRAMNDEFTSEERTLLTVDGESVETLLRAVPRVDEDGKTIGTFALYVDISKRKRLRRENEQLDQFASIVSHDLRNPLTVIKGRAHLARETCGDKGREDIEAVVTAAERMESLIDDLLMLARQGKVLDETERIELSGIIESCWQNVDTAEATLKVETTRMVQADASRLQQLLENLLRNAIEHGGDSVTITVGDLEGEFYLADDGNGIPESERESVFEPGYSTADGGTGFGLAIVTEIVDAHGWEIEVTESEDGGARFEIAITATRPVE